MSDLSENKIEVGKFYNVPCAAIYRGNGKFIGYVPIIGEAHKDKQIGVDFSHYHIDGRFSSQNDYYTTDEYGKTNGVISLKPIGDVLAFCKRIEIKKRKCKRLTTGINPPPSAKKYWDWYRTMVGKSCKGKKCPHLGVDMFEENGKLVCPLHKLIGDIKTEKIIL